MTRSERFVFAAAACLLATSLALPGAALARDAAAAAPAGPAYGPELQGFDYPWPVSRFRFRSQRQALQMAYLDIAPDPATANGKTAVLLHGKNYCSATWAPTARVLSKAGYRVIAIDQIGFCKSSKPERYQFTFQQLARNTNDLLHSLGIEHATLIGHSTGGMLGIRYALQYPRETDRLVLVDPIGLEDWRAKGVPPVSVDQWYERDWAPAPSESATTSATPISRASGAPTTSRPCRCWPACIAARAASRWRGIPRSSTT